MGHAIRLGGVLATAVATGLLVAACGGGGTGAGDGAKPAATGGGMRAQLHSYVSCLNEHGVAVSLPTAGADRSGRPQGSARPSGMPTNRPTDRPTARPSGSPGDFAGRFGGGGVGGLPQRPDNVDEQTWAAAQQACASLRPSFGTGADNSALVAYRNCLADHGVTASTGVREFSTADPKVAAAAQACAALRPTGGPRGGFSGRPGGSPSPSPSG